MVMPVAQNLPDSVSDQEIRNRFEKIKSGVYQWKAIGLDTEHTIGVLFEELTRHLSEDSESKNFVLIVDIRDGDIPDKKVRSFISRQFISLATPPVHIFFISGKGLAINLVAEQIVRSSIGKRLSFHKSPEEALLLAPMKLRLEDQTLQWKLKNTLIKKATLIKYTLAGTAIGCIFPFVAIILRSVERNISLLEAVISGGYHFWIICLAPLVLGLFGLFSGVREAENQRLYELSEISQSRKDSLIDEVLRIRNIRVSAENLVVFFLMMFILGSFSLTSSLWIRQFEQKGLDQMVTSLLDERTQLITNDINERIRALDRMASRFTNIDPLQTEINQRHWLKDAKLYYNHFGGFQALEWADAQTVIQWLYPVKGNDNILGKQLNTEAKRAASFSEARTTRQGIISEPIELIQGGMGFLTIHPTYQGDLLEPSGYVLAVYRAKDLFEHLFEPSLNYSIGFDGQKIYSHRSSDLPMSIEKNIIIRNKTFNIKLGGLPSGLEGKPIASESYKYVFFLLMALSVFLSVIVAILYQRQRTFGRINDERKMILETAGEGIYGLDLLGRTTFINSSGADMLGWIPSALIGRSQHRTIHHTKPDGSPYSRNDCPIYKAITDGTIQHVNDEVFWRKDGTSFPVEYVSSPMKVDGKTIGAVVTFKDRTQELKKEKELFKAVEKYQKALKVRSAFLANMSHEIRTPLYGMMGMTTLLKDYLEKPMTQGVKEKFLEKLELLDQSGDTLLSIVNDILDFSKLDAGKMEAESLPFDLHHMMKDVKNIFEMQIAEKGLSLTCQYEPETVPRLLGDAVKIRQILNNIIGNAIKFTKKGSIQILVRFEAPSGETSDKASICFEIRDSGIGIATDAQPKLFQPFTQSDLSTTRKYGGTGLGLSISKGLIDVMKGHISLESEPGRGTLVRFSIPVKIQNVSQTKSSSVSQDQDEFPDDFQLSILVAEDHKINCQIIEGYLMKLGCKADFAHNGLEVLDFLEKKPYDLILMDCHMPSLDGFGATEKIIERYGDNRPRIVALTASAMKEDRDACLKAGMDDFMSKPLRLMKLKKELLNTFGLLKTRQKGDL